MKLSDLSNLTMENIGTWPIPVKVATVLLICAAVMGLGYWKLTTPKIEELKTAQNRELELRAEFEGKQQKAANLEVLKKQLEDIKQTMGELLQKLPSKTQVPDLLQDISQTGLGAGLEFDIFKPSAEQPQEFYVELPIQIQVTGNYHQFGSFISGVAALQRIVTVHDVKIRPAGGDKGKLMMQATAKTYRYMDEEEEAAAENAQASQ
ncbi:MAG: type 4a pilus biogenesis protein PilO [Gammaproteobacteria bacterium]